MMHCNPRQYFSYASSVLFFSSARRPSFMRLSPRSKRPANRAFLSAAGSEVLGLLRFSGGTLGSALECFDFTSTLPP